MSATSQALTVVGLTFEFLAIFSTTWPAFYPKEKVKEEMVRMAGRTLLERAGETRSLARLTLLLLGFGMVCQGLAIFS